LLSNLDLVTESLTLMAGNARGPEPAISYSRCTPVVVSSVTPRMPSAISVLLGRGWDGPGALVLGALVHQHRGVAAVIEDHVRPVVARPGQGLVRAPPVLVQRLALPGEHRDALGVFRGALRPDRDGRGGVVLGGEDVAAGPADLGAEGGEGLDQD